MREGEAVISSLREVGFSEARIAQKISLERGKCLERSALFYARSRLS